MQKYLRCFSDGSLPNGSLKKKKKGKPSGGEFYMQPGTTAPSCSALIDHCVAVRTDTVGVYSSVTAYETLFFGNIPNVFLKFRE